MPPQLWISGDQQNTAENGYVVSLDWTWCGSQGGLWKDCGPSSSVKSEGRTLIRIDREMVAKI